MACSSVTRAVPVGVRDLQLLLLHLLLFCEVLLLELLPFLENLRLPVPIVQEGGVHRGIFAEGLPPRARRLLAVLVRGRVGLVLLPLLVAVGVRVLERKLVSVHLALQANMLVALALRLHASDEIIDRLALGLELRHGDQADRLPLELLLQVIGGGSAKLLVDAGELSFLGLILDVLHLVLHEGLVLLPPLEQPEGPAALGAGHDLANIVARLVGPHHLQRLGALPGHGGPPLLRTGRARSSSGLSCPASLCEQNDA
mmetsp:Transcript_64970/g.184501  ORF Transcript_64970/g.184501 Transcript_64970/m.184501 type:complete len:257 (-) Transcript_64970:2-772(-)